MIIYHLENQIIWILRHWILIKHNFPILLDFQYFIQDYVFWLSMWKRKLADNLWQLIIAMHACPCKYCIIANPLGYDIKLPCSNFILQQKFKFTKVQSWTNKLARWFKPTRISCKRNTSKQLFVTYPLSFQLQHEINNKI